MTPRCPPLISETGRAQCGARFVSGSISRMVALRSRRLESVFGAPLDALAAPNIHGLVASGVQEAFDLDFKLTLYGRSDADKRALAADVAALANTAGGVILLGVEEDAQARSIATPGVVVSDAEMSRMRQIVASLVAPLPVFDILLISDVPVQSSAASGAGSPTSGFFVLAVPRSPYAPHAVLVNDGLRYPRRNGTTIRYLSEPEVATAYRDRLGGIHRQADRLQEVENEAKARLDTRGAVWFLMSMVPDLPGDLVLNREVYRRFKQEVLGLPSSLVGNGVHVQRARVGSRQLLADGTMNDSPMAQRLSLELHTDGCGVYAAKLSDLNELHQVSPPATDDESPRMRLIDDEDIALLTLSGLLYLARHARDRTAAGGNASIHMQLYPISIDTPVQIGHRRQYGFPESRSAETLTAPVRPAEAAAPLDEVAEPGPSLVSAAALLTDELGQAFGIAEMGQFARDGQLRRRYWWAQVQEPVIGWANNHGIEVNEEVLP